MSKLLVCDTSWGPKPILPHVYVAVLVKLCWPLPVDLVLGVLRVVWADVLGEMWFCMLGCSFPIRGICSFILCSDNHQKWEKGSKQAHDTYECVKFYNTFVN